MRRLVFAALCSMAACAAAVACGGAYAGEEDGLPPRNDASASDARTGDETLVEIVPDGGADTAQPKSFCAASMHDFCDDFDDSSGVGAKWTSKTLASSTSARIENGALVVETVDGGSAETYLQQTLFGAFSHAIVEGDITTVASSFASAPPGNIASFEVAFAQANGPNWHLRLYHRATKTELLEAHFAYPDGGYGYTFHDVGHPFTGGANHHVRLEVTARSGQTALAKATIDTDVVFDGALEEQWQPSNVELHVGLYALVYGPAGDWKMRFDNVTLDAN